MPRIVSFRFFEGLSAINNKKLDWEAVLTLCEYLIIISPSKEIKVLDLILGYFGDLLDRNLLPNKSGIPFALRERVWKILNKAMDIAPTDKTWSKNYPDENYNAWDISVNSAIGRLSHALIQYAIWCYHGLKKTGSTITELVPEVKSYLESVLNLDQEQSISIHAVLGLQFFTLVTLDERWAKSKINLIFTHDDPHTKAGDAAWDAYTFQQIYLNSYNVLFDEYLYRLDHPSKTIDDSLNNLQTRVAQQIGFIYLHDLPKSGELFKSFLNKSDPQLLEDCLEWIGRALKEWQDTNPPKINISQLLSYFKIKPHPSTGWLFMNPWMPRSERIKLLNSILDKTQGEISPMYWIPEELETFAEEYPLETVNCIDKMIKYYQTNNEMYTMHKSFKNIFPLILEAQNKSAIEKLNKIINFLGTLGYDEFRKFLN